MIKIGSRVLDLTVNTPLYLDNDNVADGIVVMNNGALWIKNLSPHKWHVETQSGQVKVVEPNGLLPAKPGLKVSFGQDIKGVVDVK